eukprot:Gb_00181 [translate_table: standard]
MGRCDCVVLCECWNREREALSVNMGGDPVTTEPTVLKVDEDVISILEDDRVEIQVMKCIILEGKFHNLFGYHIAILNSMRNKDKVNIPLFLLKSIEKSIRAVKAEKGKAPLHQGLMKLLVDFEKDRRGVTAGPSKGVFSRLSGMPVSKVQLLLGPAPFSPMPKSGDTVLNSEEDWLSQDGDPPVVGSKDGGGRKRKPPSQVLNFRWPPTARAQRSILAPTDGLGEIWLQWLSAINACNGYPLALNFCLEIVGSTPWICNIPSFTIGLGLYIWFAICRSTLPIGYLCVVLCECWNREREALSVNMGGDPVTTEPTVLKVDEDVISILEDVTINGLEFSINEVLIVEVSGLSNEGEVITRDKTNQVGQLTKFIRDDETFCWLDSGIARESLPKPWDRVAIQVMKYLTLEGKFRKLFGYHIAILNSMRNKEKGLMKLLVDFEKDRRGVTAGPSKGVFSRLSGMPVSKVQLLLGPAPFSPMPKSGDTVLNSEEDWLSQDGDPPVVGSKDGGGRKRKPPSQVLNVADADPVEKGPAKGLDGTQTLTKELRCHLKVLNRLGGSLSNTCACINLLTLEITNYLKEVVKNLKDLSVAKEQQNPTWK